MVGEMRRRQFLAGLCAAGECPALRPSFAKPETLTITGASTLAPAYP